MTTMKKKMNICETPIPECELDTYEAVAYEEQFTFDDLKNVLTSNEIKMLRQHFIEGYSIKRNINSKFYENRDRDDEI